MRKRIPWILLAALLAIATIIAIPAIPSFLSYRKMGISFSALAGETKRLLERTEKIRTLAEKFDQDDALAGLPPNRLNGFTYRFDDALHEAELVSGNVAGPRKLETAPLLSLEFDGNDAVGVRMEEGECAVANGVLSIQWPGGNAHFETVGHIQMDRNEIAAVDIRMKQETGRTITLAWASEGDIPRVDQWARGSLTVHTIPDEAFHVYRIDLRNAIRQQMQSGDVIRRVFLRPSDVKGDKTEIDYVRFISKRSRYAEAACGTGYETLNDEMRQVLYMNVPIALAYTVEVPPGQTTLKTGLGVLMGNAPVTFRIVAESGGEKKEILKRNLTDPERWEDARIDCSEWAGRQVRFLFQVEGEPSNVAFWSNPILYDPPREKFNVVILLQDALRADHVSCYGRMKDTTPALDRFSDKGVRFLNAFSQETVTRVSCVSFMTSLYPTATGVWNHTDMLSDRYLTLAEILRSQGFATASFIQNDNAGPACGIHQGFSTLFDEKTTSKTAETMYGTPLERWLDDNRNRNVFLYLHLLDPHGPYTHLLPEDEKNRASLAAGETPVEGDLGLDAPWIERPMAEGRRRLYAAEVRYNDHWFPELLRILEKRNLADNTLFVLMADHGEHLGEHGYWIHQPPGYVQVLRVPLIMVCPGRFPAAKEIPQPVQLLDLAPTILDLAGIPRDGLLMQGESLLPLIRGENTSTWDARPILSEETIYLAKDKRGMGEWGSVFLRNWHLANSAKFSNADTTDPHNLPKATFLKAFDRSRDPDEANALENAFLEFAYDRRFKPLFRKLQEADRGIWERLTRDEETSIFIDPEAQKRLEGIGYIKSRANEEK